MTDGEPRRMTRDEAQGRASNSVLIGALVYQFPAMLPLVVEHLEENEGEMLPYLLMWDVMQWLGGDSASPEVRVAVMEWLDAAFESADSDQKDLIGAGAVEAIPNPGQPGSELRELLSPALRTMDPWS